MGDRKRTHKVRIPVFSTDEEKGKILAELNAFKKTHPDFGEKPKPEWAFFILLFGEKKYISKDEIKDYKSHGVEVHCERKITPTKD